MKTNPSEMEKKSKGLDIRPHLITIHNFIFCFLFLKLVLISSQFSLMPFTFVKETLEFLINSKNNNYFWKTTFFRFKIWLVY